MLSDMTTKTMKNAFLLLGCLCGVAQPKAKFPLDFDDTDFYLTSRKGGPPSAVIEDIRRGQEGVLVKLRQVTDELENDELKLNNIFYKLGHHDTELKSVNNGIGRLTASGRKTETKLNKHAFNVEFLHRQVKGMQNKIDAQSEDKMKIDGLQKAVDHLEDRLSEALYRLSSVENSSSSKPQPSPKSVIKTGTEFEFVAQPSTSFLHYPLRDEGACQDGWELLEGFCFFISKEKKVFKEAISSCAVKGAKLISLTESKKDVFLRKVFESDKYWTSGTDIFSPNQWSFLLTGSSIPREMWSKSYHGFFTVHRNQHCALIGKDGLEAVNCGQRWAFICEKL